ncbi:MAG: hypothetical protein AB7T06_23600 [Kofleriaceae bacterium]
MSRLRLRAPAWGRLPAIAVVIVCALVVPSSAQPKNKGHDKGDKATSSAPADKSADAKTDAKAPADAKPSKNAKPKTYDFTALDLNGRMRSPQLLYFLERANEELERASLEKRSFIPHMVRSLEEEQL